MSGSNKNGNKSRWQISTERFASVFLLWVSATSQQRHFRTLLRFVIVVSMLVTAYALVFQALMTFEGQSHSLVTGFYWALSTMTTLGYGDIAFTSDLGRIFSIFVLLSGMIFMLVLLPVTFIELFWAPWMDARAADLVPRSVPEHIHGHVILTFYGPVASALIEKLNQFGYPYIVILPDIEEVKRLVDKGIRTIYGELNDPETYLRARVEHAALVATTRSDIVNTSVVFTVRGITSSTKVIATVREDSAVEILKLAGSSRVLDLTRLMAEALARRAIGGPGFSHIVGRIDDLLIAEIDASRTNLVGENYVNAQRQTQVSIVGFWARGQFEIGQADSTIDANSVLVLAGTKQQIKEFDANYRAEEASVKSKPVIIIGGGRVGRSTATALKRRGIDYRIVEPLEERIHDPEKYVHGSGSDKSALQRAGIEDAPTIIITTRDDETNIYLTIHCRLLRPDIQIISRATFERNVPTLHRAGSNIVMSYASMGSNALFNLLQRSDLLMIAEGLDVFKVPVPKGLAGKSLLEASFREATNCSVIGIDTDDETITGVGPDTILPETGEIVLIGTPQGETEFLRLYPLEKLAEPQQVTRKLE
ncbi:potassium channel protein [Halieaceae bacterium IMCC14734]|uniref:Potassium channel protein n=1 Tax=Candidatus Litorirhabdus singularis TaxID=2518993 RepID=A0ABT3TGV4_9GAMM|nr:NAD-binding protein [Candidatus Litorirhabdus singularis]MCX2980654.1 potassium channel protein [Candidatus Litorirhabdus singularis]